VTPLGRGSGLESQLGDGFHSLRGRRVLVTGHTGFKGSWLSLWLQQLGAEVVGFSLAPPTAPSHFDILKLKMESIVGDIRDAELLKKAVQRVRPELVIHMAAQALVRQSYSDPIETYSTNVMGTLHLFEACRVTDSVRAIVNVTSDKCYENREWERGYREDDPMGGGDLYSSSKGCAELLTSSFRKSFWSLDTYGKKHQVLLASGRAGNVIGGGDWAADRLVPDAIRALSAKTSLLIRNPSAIRPWQHVLEPLRGYLMLATRLLNGETKFAQGWNFGPPTENCVSVETLLNGLKTKLPDLKWRVEPSDVSEAHFLRLEITKAISELGWEPALDMATTLGMTAAWYRTYADVRDISLQQLKTYTAALA
jgi:CDP-glucose 4,6-dehydratase